MRNAPRATISALGAVLLALSVSAPGSAAEPTRDDVLGAMRRAAAFFREQVAVEGGYVWRYSADLQLREGEGKVGPTTVWVQPPGTPSVGEVFLECHDATGDAAFLDAAREAAGSLVRGQLGSGGWTYRIEFDPADRARYAYRGEPPRRRARNVSTLDDDTTQAALRFLMRLDRALERRDETVHEAVVYALDRLLKAQYPNGAWPQGFIDPPDPEKHPVRRAAYPESWPRRPPKADYWFFYTLNDNALRDVIDTLFLAAEVYGEARYREAAERGGDFIILAQMPDPQPGWAQQYDFDMHPVWARRFEPPAVTGGEARGAIEILLSLHERTGKKKYLEPIPRALEYYRGCVLPDGRLARFYELRTNRPLYFTREYELTYEDDDLPTHYGFKVGNWVERVAAKYERAAASAAAGKPADRSSSRGGGGGREALAGAREVIDRLDSRGAWVEEGRLRSHGGADVDRIIDCRTFIANMRALAAAVRELDPARTR